MNANLPRVEGESLTLTVVQTIAEHRDVDPMELNPPLHSTIDTVALNKLFASTENGPRSGQVTFTYDELTVIIENDGTVRLES